MDSFSMGELWPGVLLLGLLLLLLFHKPFTWLIRILLRSGFAFFLLSLWGMLLPALSLGVNWFNALCLGLLGLPGFGLLLLLRWISFT